MHQAHNGDEGPRDGFVAEALPNGVLVRPKRLGHGLVDYGDRLGSGAVSVRKGAPFENTHAQGGEIIRADGVETRARYVVRRRRGLRLGVNRGAVVVIAEGNRKSEAGRPHTWQRLGAAQELATKRLRPRLSVTLQARVETHVQDVARI